MAAVETLTVRFDLSKATADLESIATAFARMREALVKIAAYDDAAANAWLKETGSYGEFDCPYAAKIAREALEDTQ